jgi:DNA/RNA endonuclease G (NUC1)
MVVTCMSQLLHIKASSTDRFPCLSLIARMISTHARGGLNKWAEVGLPGGDTYYIFRENFVTCYDARTRNPKWVMERIHRGTVKGGADRAKAEFYEEPQVDPRFRNRNRSVMLMEALLPKVSAELRGLGPAHRSPTVFSRAASDFNMSGYDRGHLAPAANHQNSIDAIRETFSLTNISPQVRAQHARRCVEDMDPPDLTSPRHLTSLPW